MRELKKLAIVTSLATRYTFTHMERAYRTKLEWSSTDGYLLQKQAILRH